MIKYCNNDVIILEKVWKKLKPYSNPKTSIVANKLKCPECGGNTIKQRDKITASGIEKTIVQCKKCGRYKTLSKKQYLKLSGRT